MTTHCYSFGGKLFIQRMGAGIGLRASACLARIVMCNWDARWTKSQRTEGILALLFVRYVDDLRMFPIRKGWQWNGNEWTYKESLDEGEEKESDIDRTRRELNKSFNDMVDCLEFTTESQEDFDTNTLPTLDVQLNNGIDGVIYFQHFTKPMCNNILLEKGTALSSSTIFNSLRQDLTRRMLNTKRQINWAERMQIINEYIQLLTNSGHKFRYIKAVVTQALTQYEYMFSRSILNPKHRRYRPLCRSRNFDKTSRIMSKYINPFIWYMDIDLKDPYRRKKYRGLNRGRTSKPVTQPVKKRTTTSIFVPWTPNDELSSLIKMREEKCLEFSNWSVKIQTKTGTPLINLLKLQNSHYFRLPTKFSL